MQTEEPVNKPKHIEIYINDVECHASENKMTGAELKALAQIAAGDRLYLETPGPHPDKPIEDHEVFHLKNGDHFYALPPGTKGEGILRLVQNQIDRVRQAYPNLVVSQQPDGSIDLELPTYELPPGWTKQQTSVLVSIPVGYPDNKPYGLYVDPDLGLASGQQAGGLRPQAKSGRNWSFFSWNSAEWDPHRDPLWKYVKIMLSRFEELS
jgi:hypothetical protein